MVFLFVKHPIVGVNYIHKIKTPIIISLFDDYYKRWPLENVLLLREVWGSLLVMKLVAMQ